MIAVGNRCNSVQSTNNTSPIGSGHTNSNWTSQKPSAEVKKLLHSPPTPKVIEETEHGAWAFSYKQDPSFLHEQISQASENNFSGYRNLKEPSQRARYIIELFKILIGVVLDTSKPDELRAFADKNMKDFIKNALIKEDLLISPNGELLGDGMQDLGSEHLPVLGILAANGSLATYVLDKLIEHGKIEGQQIVDFALSLPETTKSNVDLKNHFCKLASKYDDRAEEYLENHRNLAMAA